MTEDELNTEAARLDGIYPHNFAAIKWLLGECDHDVELTELMLTTSVRFGIALVDVLKIRKARKL